jgi:hypothetical protein
MIFFGAMDVENCWRWMVLGGGFSGSHGDGPLFPNAGRDAGDSLMRRMHCTFLWDGAGPDSNQLVVAAMTSQERSVSYKIIVHQMVRFNSSIGITMFQNCCLSRQQLMVL